MASARACRCRYFRCRYWVYIVLLGSIGCAYVDGVMTSWPRPPLLFLLPLLWLVRYMIGAVNTVAPEMRLCCLRRQAMAYG